MISHIQKKLSVPELLCQLSEEASELAKAALKLRRAITGDNPTPVTPEQARKDLLEEVADVFLCLRTLEIPLDPAAYYQTMNAKDHRWSERLSKVQDAENACDWIPTTEKMPELVTNPDGIECVELVYPEYLVMIRHAGKPTTLYSDGEEFFDADGTTYCVTRWKSMPNPPKEVQE